MEKTYKAAFLHKHEGKRELIENVSGGYAMNTDGMVYVQQVQDSSKTFVQFAMSLLDRILLFGMRAVRIDVVFGECRNLSMKNTKRNRRPRGQRLPK